MSQEHSPQAMPSPDGAPVRRYVRFRVGREEYGADITRVQEIKVWEGVTRVPHTSKHMLGVLNLRGAIVPVIDLRVRFGVEHAPFEPTTIVVVVRVPRQSGERTVGVVVDAVNEVQDIAERDIEPPPPLPAGSGDQLFITGIATCDERMIMLLDIDSLVNSAAG